MSNPFDAPPQAPSHAPLSLPGLPAEEFPPDVPRRRRGGLEADLLHVLLAWQRGEIPSMREPTPHALTIAVAQVFDLPKRPSAGGTTDALKRWAKRGFAECGGKPYQFLRWLREPTEEQMMLEPGDERIRPYKETPAPSHGLAVGDEVEFDGDTFAVTAEASESFASPAYNETPAPSQPDDEFEPDDEFGDDLHLEMTGNAFHGEKPASAPTQIISPDEVLEPGVPNVETSDFPDDWDV